MGDGVVDGVVHFLITPHGDRKRCSEPADAEAGGLITPHGDRKQGAPAAGDVSGAALITPHGDRKPRPPDCRRPRPHASHYPSWGSETSAIRRSASDIKRSSLPLMGIGNSPASRSSSGRASRTHYPSWGSETCYGRNCQRHQNAERSLPLMGIGNAGLPTWPTCSSPPHYPSWGSETLRRAPSRAGTAASLPLMGIGNLCPACERRQPALRLITPHGDRKPAVGAAGGAGRGLITPHGDRKPHDRPDHRRAHRADSLPLMGIGNPVRARHVPGASTCPHYPSWGSETAADSADGAGAKPSHYPSWGSETAGSWRAGTER